MSKKDVLDTVDIFFGAGKKDNANDLPALTETQKEIADEIARLEAELPKLEAEAEKIVAARAAKTAAKATQAAERASYPPIAEPDLAPAASAAPATRKGPLPYPAATARRTAVVTPSVTPEEPQVPERERISFVLPAEQVEFLKNYKYCRALMDGDPQYTLTEALIEAIELLRQHSEYEVFERPDFVRAREKKPRR